MNPAFAMWLNIAVAAAGAGLTAIPVTGTTPWVGLAVAVVGALNTALHAVSTAQPGPLAK